jgi:zinc transporter ZupT
MNIFLIEKCGLLSEKNLVTMTAFAAGTLLGDAVLHILPELKEGTEYKVLILVGILVFFCIE